MRVHHLINSYSARGGGAERLVRGLHEKLLERGIPSSLCGIEAHDDYEMPGARSLGMTTSKSFSAYRSVKRYLEENCESGDIVHAHLFPAMLYCSLLKRCSPAPLLATEHNTHNRRRGSFVGGIIDRFTYAGCDQVACISEGTETNLLDWRPGLRGKTTVIHNGVPLVFQNFRKQEPKGRPVVVSVGSLTLQKNTETCLRAVSLLKDLDFEYQIAGDGPLRPQLERLASELEVNSKVKFLGFMSPVARVLEKAHVFLMASKWEGFGLAAVEAMNASLPVVAADVEGLKEVVGKDREAGILVNPDSPEEIASALRLLLSKPEERTSMGEKGFVRANGFGFERMVDSYMETYEALSAP